MEAVKAIYHSPIGLIEIAGNETGIVSLSFVDYAQNESHCRISGDGMPGSMAGQDNMAEQCKISERGGESAAGNPENGDSLPGTVRECIKQLDEYFKGERKSFTVRCILSGTPFQKKVMTALAEVPYGATITYAELAERIGNKKAVRAVGGANRKNRLPIIYPCHRVIGSDGSLTGYASGLWRKKWLLEHEKMHGIKQY